MFSFALRSNLTSAVSGEWQEGSREALRIAPPFLLTIHRAADNTLPSMLPPSPAHIKLGSWDFKHP